jgi:hypothetical protein
MASYANINKGSVVSYLIPKRDRRTEDEFERRSEKWKVNCVMNLIESVCGKHVAVSEVSTSSLLVSREGGNKEKGTYGIVPRKSNGPGHASTHTYGNTRTS